MPERRLDVDFSNEIILACEAGIKELNAIADYTHKTQLSQNENMKQIYSDNRLDELPHIQNLVVALTAMLNGEEPGAATQMDETEVAEDEQTES